MKESEEKSMKEQINEQTYEWKLYYVKVMMWENVFFPYQTAPS